MSVKTVGIMNSYKGNFNKNCSFSASMIPNIQSKQPSVPNADSKAQDLESLHNKNAAKLVYSSIAIGIAFTALWFYAKVKGPILLKKLGLLNRNDNTSKSVNSFVSYLS